MLQILKQERKEAYADEINRLGIDISDAHVSEAVDSGKVIGWAIYSMSDDLLIIHSICPTDDLLLFDGIIRSVLFLAEQKGIQKALIAKGIASTARRLKLLEDGEDIIYPISSVFSGCKHCKENKS